MQQGKIVNETSPLLQNPSINQATKSNARNAISFEERLIDAEIDTGEIEDTFSWRKLWKYTGPGEFHYIILIKRIVQEWVELSFYFLNALFIRD